MLAISTIRRWLSRFQALLSWVANNLFSGFYVFLVILVVILFVVSIPFAIYDRINPNLDPSSYPVADEIVDIMPPSDAELFVTAPANTQRGQIVHIIGHPSKDAYDCYLMLVKTDSDITRAYYLTIGQVHDVGVEHIRSIVTNGACQFKWTVSMAAPVGTYNIVLVWIENVCPTNYNDRLDDGCVRRGFYPGVEILVI
jgi:hypothetical protein